MVRSMLVAALMLIIFAVTGTAIVALTYNGTRKIIAENERAALLASLNELIAPDRYDNRLTEDYIEVSDPRALGTGEPVRVYRAFKQGRPVALVATPVAPDGYGGPIPLLVGVYADGTLAGVRVLVHQETPGLGDAIETRHSDWILSFTGRSLREPDPAHWAVKKDGGAFDQFTGATITPRAVVRAVREFLVYFAYHRNRLFAARGAAHREGSR